ncbi:shikimate kinase [Methanolobus halotolerans]|uniref:Shikimate kinase n=1 Tax=Methanolobus halotolerans TaxID=2052935 RepID=A0A4E0QQM7_9EURY|nr:shikimate kinase [Methanolobus halotolerans]TGC08046.1 shikimate kinase [Methanolobus halotolerans]
MIITLIGMPGAGKSSVGKALARHLDYCFIDTDTLIREHSGKALQKLIDEKGDFALIEVEEECILSLELQDNCIISTGGSVIYSEKAMYFLQGRSCIIFLDVPFGIIKNRLSNIDTRGVVGLKSKGLYQLYKERSRIYADFADIRIRVKGKNKIRDVMEKIVARTSVEPCMSDDI